MKVLTLAALALAAFVALAAPAAAASKKPKTQYYLSLGDSLSVGIQPGPADNPGHEAESVETNDGYTEQLFTKAKRLYPGLKLVKAGCSGATTENFLRGGINVTGLGTCTPPQPLYKSTSARHVADGLRPEVHPRPRGPDRLHHGQHRQQRPRHVPAGLGYQLRLRRRPASSRSAATSP